MNSELDKLIIIYCVVFTAFSCYSIVKSLGKIMKALDIPGAVSSKDHLKNLESKLDKLISE